MAFVKFKRNWFGPDGKRYRANIGLIEINDQAIIDQLPSDAEVFDGQGLPTLTLRPKPGFGAKPAHELLADQLPGGGPTKILPQNKQNLAAVDLDDPEEKERRNKAEAAQQEFADRVPGSVKSKEDKHAEEQATIDANLPLVQEAAEEQQKIEDPAAALAVTAAPKAPVAPAKHDDSKTKAEAEAKAKADADAKAKEAADKAAKK